MSAFEVSKAHIDAMISAALAPDSLNQPLSWYGGNPTRQFEVTWENAEQWGLTLVAENRASVNSRYEEEEIEDLYTFTRHLGPFDPIAVIKITRCYMYQACEHPEWEASEAHALCKALILKMIYALPGYDEAPWAISDVSEVRDVA
jgi:hypothetical protein